MSEPKKKGFNRLARTRLPLAARFAILFSALAGAMAATAHSETFELLPQVGRLHLEFEMGACLLLGIACRALYTMFPRWTRPVLLAICLGPLRSAARRAGDV